MPVVIDVASSLENALDDIKYWREKEGESAILVSERRYPESTLWIEIKGY
jgi:hypothetical protein